MVKERFSSGRGWRVTTPSFPECAAMDSFYAEAHRLIEADFSTLRERSMRGICAADFAVREDGGTTEVTLRLRLRRDGRWVREKTVVHRWRNGRIAPSFNIIPKIARKHKREKLK